MTTEPVAGCIFTGEVEAGEAPPRPARRPGPEARLFTNQEFIESLRSPLDPHDIKSVFQWVFSRLPAKPRVYPTENYYYFSFYAGGRCYWGNFRLGVGERDRGILNFVYWEYLDDPQGPDESPAWMRAFTAKDGVVVRKLDPLRYAVSFRGRKVVFQLNGLSQRRPKALQLSAGEKFLGRTCDESGFYFFLLFARRHRHFMWVLDERELAPLFESLAPDLEIDRLSGFVFYLDRARQRKILVGVAARNVRRNNYWDGPFDQLPDNFVRPELARSIAQAYPHTKGRIDRYGKFIDQPGFRVAITPYLEYESLGQMKQWVVDCRKHSRGEFLACITYDSKKDRA